MGSPPAASSSTVALPGYCAVTPSTVTQRKAGLSITNPTSEFTVKTFRLLQILALIAAAVSTAASAKPYALDIPEELPMAAPMPVSHAAVIADFYVWRAAGLQSLSNDSDSVDYNSPAYRKAWARYQYLRNSPQFDALVDQIKRDPNTTVSLIRR